ncbi:MAG: tubulin-like doman-containing protein [Gemmataceae bacterium]
MAIRLDRDYEPLPGYRLIDRLGRGGFGEVWKVEAPGQLMKAMKFVFGNLETNNEEDGKPAEQELKALNRVKTIRHPYILSLERIDIVDGQLIIVMELADKNLWDRFRECRQQKLQGIPRDELLKYLSEAAEALDLMNDDFHIQHLDVKPQNLFVLHNHIKVADFGLAKAFEGGRGTITGGVTPVYAAPETFEGYASRYTDQYSLAIVFQELLTGTRPFNGSNTKQLLMQHLNGIPDLSSLPLADKPIIARALSKKPDDRWRNCVEMIQALSNSGSMDTPLPHTPYGIQFGGNLSPRTPVPNFADSKNGTLQKQSVADTHKTIALANDSLFSRPIKPTTGTVKSFDGLKLITPKTAAETAAASGRLIPTNPFSRPAGEIANAKMQMIAPAEIVGDGVLFPTLIVGVGGHGRLVLQRLRQMLRTEFGSLDAVPHIRFLFIDTDADEIALATNAEIAGALTTEDVYFARLNRPGYYLQRDGLPPIEQWMPQGFLYKLPKEPKNSGGVRSFGRLALFDHFRPLAAKIRKEIQNFATDEAIKKAAEQTGRGIRTNSPRTYIISATTGGTGGGMVLDLAYMLKHEFQQVGYLKSTIHGILLVPPADKTKQKGIALANTYAVLGELNHFSSEGTLYQTKFDTNDSAISDPNAPFTRCFAIQLPDNPGTNKIDRTIGLVSRNLWLDMVTTVGRVTESVRDEALALPRNNVPIVQTFGLFRFTWPRQELLKTLGRRFGSQLLSRWASKETAHLREPIKNWLSEQWTKRELTLEQLVEKFEQSAEAAFREKPDRVFDAFVDPLRVRFQGAGKFDENVACDIIEELFKLVGQPDPDADSQSKIDEALRVTSKYLSLESENHISTLTVSFIEQPQYRLAGADEAISQIEEKLKQTIQTLDNVRKGLIKEVVETYEKLYNVIQTLSKDATGLFGVRRTGHINDMCELLRRYPRLRLKLAILDRTAAFYRSLLIQCPDFVREIAACRTRLMELSARVADQAERKSEEMTEPSAVILPPGCNSLDAAADEFLNALSPDEILAFEQDLQRSSARRFRGVVNVCVKTEYSTDFLDLLARKSGEFLEPRVEKADPAAVFLRYKEGQSEISHELSEAFDLAAPDLTTINGSAPSEATLLAAPSGPSGDQLRQFVSSHLEGVEFIPAPLGSDVVIYREYPLLEISALPQQAEHARDAYVTRLNTAHPPHARSDIRWEMPQTEPERIL